jgi:ribosome-associated toxin RatA of RatAB toxin-antitoxin module
MPTINKSTVVPYTQEQMYALVNDVSTYAEFVPWCVKSRALDRSEDEVHGELTFSKGGLEKAFSTINRLQPHKMIELRLLNGPFKQLEGFWRFEELGDNESRVMLDLEYEFSNMLIAMMFGPVFQQVAVTLVDAFSDRAKVVYGS